jgi:hypothetical protein
MTQTREARRAGGGAGLGDFRFSVASSRAPIGRSRLFRLQCRDIDELISHAERLESRV